ncbi:hypothetical protein B0H14DRAFT_2796045, partial [Mycena olivaceomarginata]
MQMKTFPCLWHCLLSFLVPEPRGTLPNFFRGQRGGPTEMKLFASLLATYPSSPSLHSDENIPLPLPLSSLLPRSRTSGYSSQFFSGPERWGDGDETIRFPPSYVPQFSLSPLPPLFLNHSALRTIEPFL